jgi:hypothetical protein
MAEPAEKLLADDLLPLAKKTARSGARFVRDYLAHFFE